MVNAAHSSTPRATTPPSPHHAKISHHQPVSLLPAISNRHKLQLESSVTSRKQTTAPNSYQHKFCPKSALALRPPAVTTHDSPLAAPRSAAVNSIPLFPFSVIATQILDIELTRSQQTRKHFLIATFFTPLRMLGTSPLTSLDSLAALTTLHPSPTMKSVPCILQRIAHHVAAVADHGSLITNHHSLLTDHHHV